MQAPIGPATTPELVAAVCEAGGLGCLAASWTPPRVLRDHLRRIRGSTDRPFCVNLVLAFDQDERLDLLLEESVAAVSFSWGVDAAKIARAAGMTVLVQVGDARAAAAAEAAGATAVIAQGVEAGGHVEGTAALDELIRTVRAAVEVPVLAAGGIASAASVEAAVAAGADGVAAGTAFLAATEADVHPHYRERLLAAQASDTVLTGVFDVGWPDAPHRVLRNRTLTLGESGRPGAGRTVASRRGRPVVRYSDEQPTRDIEGDVEAMALYAGCGVGDVVRAEPAAAITERLLAATRPRGGAGSGPAARPAASPS